MNKNILIITGEPSGDTRGSELLAELKPLFPDTHFWGFGGDTMATEGCELIEHVQNLSIVGVWEAIVKLPRIHAQYKNLTDNVTRRKPLLAILIDYPGFNLRVAKFLHSQGIPVIYYITPQVWAWGQWRVKSLKNYVDKALPLFKFEEKFLSERGVSCQAVGHPLLDKISPSQSDEKNENFTIALMPGSRKTEVHGTFPVMLEAAERIRKYQGDVNFVLAESSNIDSDLYAESLKGHKTLPLERIKDDTFKVLEKCDFAIVASGTATLETAIMEKPMVVVYRVALLTALLFKAFVRMPHGEPHIALVNIIAGGEVVPELLQLDLSPESLSKQVLEIIGDDSMMNDMKQRLKEIKKTLGGPGASKRAAEAIREFAKERGVSS